MRCGDLNICVALDKIIFLCIFPAAGSVQSWFVWSILSFAFYSDAEYQCWLEFTLAETVLLETGAGTGTGKWEVGGGTGK